MSVVVVACPHCQKYRATSTHGYVLCFRCGKKTHIKHLRVLFRGEAAECHSWIAQAPPPERAGPQGFITFQKVKV